MKRLSLLIGLLLVSAGTFAQTRIPSGTTDQYAPFVAVDPTDKVTREPGLSGFTVYRKRENGTTTAMTTPTVVEADASNMPGVYLLLLDEDTTIGAGNDNEIMTLHITATGMEPVSTVVEIYRPKITEGSTSTAQTGDVFSRLGAPSGASTAADIAALAALLNAYRLAIIDEGTLQAVDAASATLRAAASFENGTLEGAMLLLTNGTYAGSRVFLSGNTGDAVTFTEWPGGVTPTGTPTYVLFGTAPSVGGSGVSADEVADEVETRSLIVGTNNDKTGYGLADGAITAAKIATDAFTAAKLAADAVTEIQSGLATAASLSALQADVTTLLGRLTAARAGYMDNLDVGGDVASSAEIAALDALIDALDAVADAINSKADQLLVTSNKLDDTLEDDAGLYRFTINALEQAPDGGGGGSTDWTSDERAAMRSILGIPGSGTTPADPSTGILDGIRDAVATRASQSSVDSTQTAIAALVNQIRDLIVEDQGSGVSMGCQNAAALAVLAGRASVSGNTVTYRDPSNGEVRVVVTHDATGNRTAAAVTCPTY